ncbi:diaminopropionate ammonia-lyase [Pseudomonas sp. JS3066]|uniref:diaminopropionate ammonia-lyase n=1 Tax=unclassified Pseudomonas TaxID=196821 RepID=UPI00129DF09E|nr:MULTISPECIES: diaminopropionate ammonia-lyase [unclassified Pseudomonas]MRK21882.1 diaminopropionate ammonia-lyase [Pseudomonas sp. JG-B]WVK95713.1 diaminopropionate ammonia-lyase [Pseudomonas sp. JS3066]
MLIANPKCTRRPYPDDLRAIMSVTQATESRTLLSSWSRFERAVTPLWQLPDLARDLGVGQVLLKDEAVRSALGSFKVLGAPVALVRLILRRFPDMVLEPRALLAGNFAESLAEFTVISATDGNHGRALAAAAQSVGCRCVIVLHAHVSTEREQAIAAYGARIIRIDGNYDDSVHEAARLAATNGWTVVSDTSYEGYTEIPRDVMQGYAIIAAEALEALAPQQAGCPFSHVFLQGGVGGLAAGIASYLWERYGAARPTMIVVEPTQADCLYQSALTGKATRASGSVDSVMAGLACGETSPLAWQFLEGCIDHFMTVEDAEAVAAMRVLAKGSERDLPLVAGESAVAGLAGLRQLMGTPQAAELGLDRQSRVLLISTEGATAPALYAELVGEPASAVLARQEQWLQVQ